MFNKLVTYIKEFFIAIVVITTITTLAILFSTTLISLAELSYEPFKELSREFYALINSYGELKTIAVLLIVISIGSVIIHNLNKN